MKHSDTKRFLSRVLLSLIVMVALYIYVAWPVFQWRNPLSNEMSFFRNFVDVLTWKKLPEYQPSLDPKS